MTEIDGKSSAPSRAWRLYLILGLVGVLGYSLLPPDLPQNLHYQVTGIVAVVAMSIGLRLNRPALALPWYLAIGGQALLVVGDGIYNYYELILHVESPFPSVADVAYLGGYLVLICGVTLMLRSRAAGGDAGDTLDAAIITVGLAVVVWVYLTEPYARDASLPLMERVVSISYPLIDVLLIALAARMLLSRGTRQPAFYFVSAGLVLTLVADATYAALVLNGSYQSGSFVDNGWLVSYVLWGVAALHPSMRNLSETGPERQPKLSRGRVASLVAAALLAPTVLLFEHLRGNSGHELAVEWSAVALFLLVLARLIGTLRRHERFVAREQALRTAGIKLVAAPDRDGIYAAALDAAIGLLGGVPSARVGLALGSEEGMTVVASAGSDASRIQGDPLNLVALPAPSRERFLTKQPVEVEGGEAADLRGALGLATNVRPFFLVPLFVQDEIRGAIGVTSDAPIPAEIKNSLVSLASQVALALEGVALAEDKHRRQSERRFRALIQNSADILTVVDAGGKVVYQSPSMFWVLGHDPAGRVGLDISRSELVHPEDLSRQNGTLAEATRNPGILAKTEVRMRHRDGAWRIMESTFQSLPDDPNVGGTIINSRDVTKRREAESALRESEEKYRGLVETVQEGIAFVDADERISYCNAAYARVFGLAPDELVGRSLLDFLDEAGRAKAAEQTALRREGKSSSYELVITAADGREKVLSTSGSPVSDPRGRFRGAVHAVVDVTEQRRAQEGLRESERRLSALLANAPAYVYRCHNEPGWPNEFVSEYARELTGYSAEELTDGRVLFGDLIVEEDRQRVWDEVQAGLSEHRRFAIEYGLRRKDGQIRHVEERGQGVYDGDGSVEAIEGVVYDVTGRKLIEEELAHRALHDPLTGLPNRDLLLDRLGQALARAARSGRRVAVLFMDLDDFKYVNDSLGHDAGDGLLVQVAERLRAGLRPEDTVARMGGDEFVVLLEGLEDEAEAEEAAARLTDEVSRPFSVEGQEVFATFSVGIAMDTPGEARHDDLLRKADAAMYGAKNDGKDRHRIFDDSMNARARVRLELASDLRRALERDELSVCYQPTVSLKSGRVVGLEALVRWEHPRKGLLLPGEFVPVAEENGLIVPLGRHVMREACRRSKEWQGAGRAPLTTSVNLSVRQLQDPGLLADVSGALEKGGLAPGRLVLEITESALMGDVPRTSAVLRELRALGVRIAIDDFGTGYSSLAYLERFPVDVLKVDRTFVGRIGRDAKGKALVWAVIDLARALGLDVVAEGVETAEQARELSRLGCEVAQGYYFAKPLDARSVSGLLAQPQLL